MNHEVIKEFVDKELGVFYTPGSFYISDNYERVTELEKMGFVKANQEVSTLKKSEKKTTRKKASGVNARED